MSMSSDEQAAPLTERTEPVRRSEASTQSSLTGPASQSPTNSEEGRSPFSSMNAANEFLSSGRRPSNGLEYSVDLHIEELMLHGFAPGDRRQIGDSFEAEMNRLLTDTDISPSFLKSGEIALSNELEFDLASNASPESIGRQIARVIFRSFNHE